MVPGRKCFPPLEYFFYYAHMVISVLCYGRGIQCTAKYISTLTTRISIAMTQNVRYSFKVAGTCVTKQPNSTT